MKKNLLSVVLLVAAMMTQAQPQALPKLPIDSAIRVGHLDNGLTYFIRHNEMPKQRCEFHIAQAVGAILEEDNQNGLAHFLEHMAFNGTQHFPGKGIINYFESIGVSFGGDINAYTSIDETVYRLSNVPTIREGIIDSALLVMHDWACGLSLLAEEIDNERGVIREEWRTGANANRRMWAKSNAQMFPGSQYAKRDVIGDTAIINNFAYDALRAYYRKWYGPDNQAIIVVGDIDVDAIEAKIRDLWKDVPARTNRGERPYYTIDDNDEPIVSLVQDDEAQTSICRVFFKQPCLPEALCGTQQQMYLNLANSLMWSVIDERFADIALDPNSPILQGGASYGDLVKTKDAFSVIAVAKQGQEVEAYQLLLTEIERLSRYGITDAELERAKAELLSQYENDYNDRASRQNQSYAREYIRYYLDHTYIPGIEFEFEGAKQLLPHVDAATINKLLTHYISDKNVIIAFQGPQLPKFGDGDCATAVVNRFKARHELDIEAPKAENEFTPLVKKAPYTGKIKKTEHNETMGTTEFTLSNGIRVIILPTEYKKDEIIMRAASLGGTSLIPNVADLPSAQLATAVVDFMGYGDFSRNDLTKALAGKQCSASFSLSELAENVSGSSTIKDFETMLQLVYLGFTSPRRDENAYTTLMNFLYQQIANKDKNPKNAWSDSIGVLLSGNSERHILLSKETLEQMNLDRAMAIYRERFANPADFTFFFVGNINPDDPQTRQQICQWLGGLKTKKNKQESFRDWNIRVPAGIQHNYFTREMQTRTASNYIQYTSYDIPYTMDNDVNLDILGSILSTRYLESIREREGGSYGVGCYATLGRIPVPCAKLVMRFDTDPLKQERLMAIIHEEVQTILRDGPLESDLLKEKQILLKSLDEDLEKNGWWLTTLYLYDRYGTNRVTEYRKAVENITAESVQTILKKLVASGNLAEVVMFPE
ncbi:MAG: insulinase family protein [Paludibacteraceae bacterium]|nr:insulinase family protein [Paludibacteraceae bacterium]